MNTDQIVSEAADKICQLFAEALGESIGVQTSPIEAIIKSAIEKAYPELTEQIRVLQENRAADFENYKYYTEENSRLSASSTTEGKHASEKSDTEIRFRQAGLCPKCGHHGFDCTCDHPAHASEPPKCPHCGRVARTDTEGPTIMWLCCGKSEPKAHASEQGVNIKLVISTLEECKRRFERLGQSTYEIDEQLKRLSQRPTPATPTMADLERRERDKHEARMATPATASEPKDEEGRTLSEIQEFEHLSLEHDDPTMIRAKPDPATAGKACTCIGVHSTQCEASLPAATPSGGGKEWEVREQRLGYMIFAKDGDDVVDFLWHDEKYPTQIVNAHKRDSTRAKHPRIYSTNERENKLVSAECPSELRSIARQIERDCPVSASTLREIADNLESLQPRDCGEDTKRLEKVLNERLKYIEVKGGYAKQRPGILFALAAMKSQT